MQGDQLSLLGLGQSQSSRDRDVHYAGRNQSHDIVQSKPVCPRVRHLLIQVFLRWCADWIGEIGGSYSIWEMWDHPSTRDHRPPRATLQDTAPRTFRRLHVASYIPIPVLIPPSPNLFQVYSHLVLIPVMLMRGWSCNVSYRHIADWGWGSTTSPTELHRSNASRLGPKSIGPMGITTLVRAEIIMSKNSHLTLTLSGL